MRGRCLARRFLGMVVLLTLLALLPALPAGADGPYNISGRVTDAGGGPLAGVTLLAESQARVYLPLVRRSGGGAQSGPAPAAEPDAAGAALAGENNVSSATTYTATTDSNGNYKLSGLPPGAYTVTPVQAGASFSPTTRTVILPPSRTGQDFVCTGGCNHVPNTPSSPAPGNGATDQSLDVDVGWTGGDPDGDAVTYDVYFEAGDSSPDVLVSNDQSATGYDPGTLAYTTHYYWQIMATDEHGAGTTGPVWGFKTMAGGSDPVEVILIPAGSFQMGCDLAHNGGFGCGGGELPLHTVTLDAYTIDKYEVTNARYAVCVAAGGCAAPTSNASLTYASYYGNPVYADYPVIYVSWYDASDYCAWAGKRLPTEAEWEKAARGKSDTRAYPWGDASPSCTLANSYYNSTSSYCVGDTSQVGDYPAGASPYGVLDMAGNVFEWVADWHDAGYYSSSPASNPPGPTTGTTRVLRGGSFFPPDWDYVRVAYRDNLDPNYSFYDIGFRCVGDAPGP